MGLFGVLKFLFVRSVEVFVVLALIIIMPSIPPDAKFSDIYKVTKPLPLEKKLAVNERLSSAELWHKGDFVGPECFAEYNGELYTGIHGGDIVKLSGEHITPVVKFGKPCKGLHEERICGRPLGLAFDKNGALFAADAYYGIYKVDVKTGNKVQLVSKDTEIGGKKPMLFNSLVIASNGDIYWTDSSTEFTLEDGVYDMLADGSGRLIHYNARTKQNTVLIENIHFANGVAFSEGEEFIVVSESARNRLRRYYLKGPKKGTHDVFIDGLPGLPDNLRSDGQGGFFVPLVMARDQEHPQISQSMGQFPRLRRLAARLMGLVELGFKLVDQVYPNEFCQRSVHFVGHFTSMTMFTGPKRVTIVHLNGKGEITDSVHSTTGKFDGISEVFIYNDFLLLGTPFNDYIARVPLATVGWKHFAPIAAKKEPVKQAPPPTTTPKPTTTQRPTTTTPRPTTKPPTKATTPPPPPTTTLPPPPPTTKPPTKTRPPPQATKPIPQQRPQESVPQQKAQKPAVPQQQAVPKQAVPQQRVAQQGVPQQAVPKQAAPQQQQQKQTVPPTQQQQNPRP